MFSCCSNISVEDNLVMMFQLKDMDKNIITDKMFDNAPYITKKKLKLDMCQSEKGINFSKKIKKDIPKELFDNFPNFFKDKDGKYCFICDITDTYFLNDAIEALLSIKTDTMCIELYKGPSFPDSDYQSRLDLFHFTIHRKYVMICRVS